jgi:hypothetical protein
MQEWIAVAALIVAASSFAVNLYNNKATGVWDLSDRLNSLDRDLDKRRQLLYKHVDDKHDEAMSAFGETINGYTEHVRQIELELYKNFVRQPFFDHTIETINKTINDRFDRLERRLDKAEAK